MLPTYDAANWEDLFDDIEEGVIVARKDIFKRNPPEIISNNGLTHIPEELHYD